MTTYSFKGSVVDADSRVGIPSVQVEAHDLRHVVPGAVAVAKTSSRGLFEMQVDSDQLRRLFGDKPVVLYFVVRSGASELGSTEGTLSWSAQKSASGRIEVKQSSRAAPAPATRLPEYTVEGRVTDRAGLFQSGLTIAVFVRHLTRAGFGVTESSVDPSTPPVPVVTNSEGAYRFVYRPSDLSSADEISPDLVVTASSGTTEIGRATLCNASPRAFVDIVIGGVDGDRDPGPTRFARVAEAVQPFVGTETGYHPENFTEEEIDYLACRTPFSATELTRYRDAFDLHVDHTTVSAEVFFGLLHQGLPTTNLFSYRMASLRAALEKSLSERAISPDAVPDLNDTMALIETEALAALRVVPLGDPGQTALPLGVLIDSSPTLRTGSRDPFLKRVLNSAGSAASFWAAVDLDTATFNDEDKKSLKFTASAAHASGYFKPVIDKLHARYSPTDLQLPEDLAKLTEADWLALIESISSGPQYPADTPGEASGDRRAAYAKSIAKSVESRFRTPVIRARIAASSAPADAPLKTFLADSTNASFDFFQHRVSKYLSDTPTALDSVPSGDRASLVDRLKGIERVARVTDQWAETTALVDAGLTSAFAIHQYGRDRFIQDHAGLGARAAEIYDAACWPAATSLALKQRYGGFDGALAANVLPDGLKLASPLPSKITDWSTLFGSVDACACEHCHSVLGPAAYMADVFEMLGRHPRTSGGGTARDELFTRRPDLPKIALDCANAETALPYVDLVNEILEVKVATTTWPSTPVRIETSWEANELLTMPETLYPTEHVNAYLALEGAVFPFRLPFHLWQEEARIYLTHLGVPMPELLLRLAPPTGVDGRQLAIERLGTTGKQYDIIAGAGTAATSEYWGITSNWPAELSKVKVLLDRAELSFPELQELLATNYCNTPGEVIRFEDDPPCDLATLDLVGLDAAGGDPDSKRKYLHRLLRLRKVLGWSITDTDRAATALGALGAPELETLAGVRELERRFQLPPDEVLSWYFYVDRSNRFSRSLFERTFLDRRSGASSDAVFSAIFTSDTFGATLSEVRGGLARSLGVTDSDLALLIDAGAGSLGLAASVATQTADIANLSRLFRIVSFARATQLGIRSWLLLRQLSGAGSLVGDDGSTATPDTTLAFLDTQARVARSPMSLDELHYVVRHVAPAESPLLPTPKELIGWRAQIEAAVAGVAADTMKLEDPDGTTLAALGTLLLSPSNALILTQLATRDPALSDPEAFVNGPLAPFLGTGGPTGSVTVALAYLTGSNQEQNIALRRTFLARRLQRYLASERSVTVALSGLFRISPEVAALLVSSGASGLLHWSGGPASRAFLPGDEEDWTAARGSAAEREELLIRVAKAALVLSRHDLDAADVAAAYPVSGSTSTLPKLDFDTLPVAPPPTPANVTAAARADFARLVRWADFVALRAAWPPGRASLLALFASAATATFSELLDTVATATGWNRTDLDEIASRLGITTAASFQDEAALVRISSAFEAVRRLGVPASRAIGWLGASIPLPTSPTDPGPNSLTVAAEIREAARARHDQASWTEVARPLRNALRDRQRDALVGHLLNTTPAVRSSDLYEQLLIDVDMDPCMLTSRLVQAHGSAQLFVQRLLLNLESASPKNLAPREDTGREWRWMKNYRVWEANRKVFLWPENWIEPELRGDKTPLFEAYEQALLSGALDKAALEEAVRTYLDGLADVANLEVVAMCTEGTDPPWGFLFRSAPVVHVFGRTPGTAKYFYRRREAGNWTPWETVDLEIQGEHVMAFVFGGRLFVAWAIMEDIDKRKPYVSTEEQASKDRAAKLEAAKRYAQEHNLPFPPIPSPQPVTPPKPPQLETSVRVALSERRGATWSRVHKSAPAFLGASPLRDPLHFVTAVDSTSASLTLQYESHELVRYRYYPGTYQFPVAQIGDPLTDPDEKYGVGVVPDFPPGTGPDLSALALPFGMERRYQAFGGSVASLDVIAVQQSDFVLAEIVGFSSTADRGVVGDAQYGVPNDYFVLKDGRRSFFIDQLSKGSLYPLPNQYGTPTSSPSSPQDVEFRVAPFYHPYVTSFRNALAVGGLEGLYRPAQQTVQLQAQRTDLLDGTSPAYALLTNAEADELVEQVELELGSAYGVYNWELFFHMPFLTAIRLSAQGKYEEAMDWFHYIFDPTDGASAPGVSRLWKFKPFADNKDLASIQSELETLAETALAKKLEATIDGSDKAVADALSSEISAWRDDPFDPHLIARMRPVAYQKAVVMRYIENLLKWADSLFARDSMESVNEATQLYLLAQNLLGPRPTLLPEPAPPAEKSYDELRATSAFDAFSNAIVDSEVVAPKRPRGARGTCGPKPPPHIIYGSLYFCVPPNEKLLGYWDTVADRLFKIRNCQNIQGVTRVIPLFEPPIDPALLVRAAAQGLDVGSAIYDANVAAPPYRYSVLYAKATELAGYVAGIGQSYLAALEKSDAEALSNLRQGHDVALQEVILQTRRTQLREARENLVATQRSLKAAEERLEFYSTRQLVSPGESAALALTAAGQVLTSTSALTQATAAVSAAVPQFTFGIAGLSSAVITVTGGGQQAAESSGHSAEVLSTVGAALTLGGTITGTMAGYQRRMEDWQLQARLARAEIAQIESQITAAQIRVNVAERELDTTEKQLDQARDVESFLKSKFTNQELYGWMQGQLSSLYFQAYSLAYEMAKRAERAFQYERGDVERTQTFVTFANWDGLRKGLLAGDKLLLDLRRMDAAYISQNTRELELVKTVSLAEHAPKELVKLRDGLPASFALSEDDYDRDFRSHYLRRLKTVAVTVSCTTGPYQGVLGTLTLANAETRPGDDAPIKAAAGVVESIVTSQGQMDSGLFELVFRDDRFLPFEGAGAHSSSPAQFTFDLSKGNRFAYDTIDDLVMEVRYTARAGKLRARQTTASYSRLVRIRDEFPEAWQAFTSGATNAVSLSLPIETWTRTKAETGVPTISSVRLEGWWTTTTPTWTPVVTPPGGSATTLTGSTSAGRGAWSGTASGTVGTWTVDFGTPTESERANLRDLWIILDYSVTVSNS